MTENPPQTLRSGLARLGFSARTLETLSDKMDKYIRELLLFNSAYNLVNTNRYEEIAVRHVLDSLAGASVIQEIAEQILSGRKEDGQPLTVGDIGSGGGLPGIPLAAAFPQYRFSLVERMDRRCAFLENAAAVIGLQNAAVVKSEAERLPRPSFDITVFRAYRPLDRKNAETLLALTKKGGVLAAYKARRQNILKEMGDIRKIVPEYEVRPVFVPFLTESNADGGRERNLVLIRRV